MRMDPTPGGAGGQAPRRKFEKLKLADLRKMLTGLGPVDDVAEVETFEPEEELGDVFAVRLINATNQEFCGRLTLCNANAKETVTVDVRLGPHPAEPDKMPAALLRARNKFLVPWPYYANPVQMIIRTDYGAVLIDEPFEDDGGWFQIEPVATAASTAPTAAASSIKLEALMVKDFPEVKYVVPGLIVEGLTLFAGKPKIGKSWLLLHAAVAVAAGKKTLGDIQCPQGAVLYCALEDSQRRLKSRLKKLFGFGWTGGGFDVEFRTEMPRLADGGLAILEQWIVSAENPRMVIIDTLAMVRSPKKRDESPYDADYASVQALRTLAAKHGVAIVVVHHLRKQDADDPFDLVSGTLGLTGAPDTILVLRRDGSGRFVLNGQGRDITEVEMAMRFNKESATWSVQGDAAEVRLSDERGRILRALTEPMGPKDIAALTGMKEVNVRRLLVNMLRDGSIEKAAYGKYQRRSSSSGHTDHTTGHTAPTP